MWAFLCIQSIFAHQQLKCDFLLFGCSVDHKDHCFSRDVALHLRIGCLRLERRKRLFSQLQFIFFSIFAKVGGHLRELACWPMRSAMSCEQTFSRFLPLVQLRPHQSDLLWLFEVARLGPVFLHPWFMRYLFPVALTWLNLFSSLPPLSFLVLTHFLKRLGYVISSSNHKLSHVLMIWCDQSVNIQQLVAGSVLLPWNAKCCIQLVER